MYDTQEQSNLRLTGTIVGYDGRPVRVLGTNQNNTINIVFLPKGGAEVVVRLDDPKLNVREFKLGYVNYEGDAVYVTRQPARQQRQGLHKNVLIGKVIPQNRPVFWDALLSSPGFADAFRGIYPSFEDSIQILRTNENVKSIAFARRFALTQDHDLGFFELLYRGNRIAWGDPHQFNIPSEFIYMSELMKQEGINVR